MKHERRLLNIYKRKRYQRTFRSVKPSKINSTQGSGKTASTFRIQKSKHALLQIYDYVSEENNKKVIKLFNTWAIPIVRDQQSQRRRGGGKHNPYFKNNFIIQRLPQLAYDIRKLINKVINKLFNVNKITILKKLLNTETGMAMLSEYLNIYQGSSLFLNKNLKKIFF